jgi:hypothetical protein
MGYPDIYLLDADKVDGIIIDECAVYQANIRIDYLRLEGIWRSWILRSEQGLLLPSARPAQLQNCPFHERIWEYHTLFRIVLEKL